MWAVRTASTGGPPKTTWAIAAATRSAAGSGRSRHQRHELLTDVARDPARHLVLVTATPHSGKDEGFRNLLEVTPVDMDSVHPVQGAEAGPPALAETPDGQSFTADLSEVWPSPRRLRRELAKHLPADAAGA